MATHLQMTPPVIAFLKERDPPMNDTSFSNLLYSVTGNHWRTLRYIVRNVPVDHEHASIVYNVAIIMGNKSAINMLFPFILTQV